MIKEYCVTLTDYLILPISFIVTTTSEFALIKYMEDNYPNENYEYKEETK